MLRLIRLAILSYLVVTNFSCSSSYPKPLGSYAKCHLNYIFLGERFTVKEVCWEGFWSAFSATSPWSCLILCLVSWSTSYLKSSLSCQILHSSLSTVDHSEVLLLWKEWQFFRWGESMYFGLTKNAYWGSWNRRQCLTQILMHNTCSLSYGYDGEKRGELLG